MVWCTCVYPQSNLKFTLKSSPQSVGIITERKISGEEGLRQQCDEPSQNFYKFCEDTSVPRYHRFLIFNIHFDFTCFINYIQLGRDT